MKKKIGVFGGTFDPVHIGHIQLAETAIKKCSLHRVIFLPSASPPHKQGVRVADFSHRVSMLEIALKGISYFEISTLEQHLPSPSYTIDTLNCLNEKRIGGEILFFLTGVDAFLELETWKEYQRVLANIHFIIFQRSGYDVKKVQELIEQLHYSGKGKDWENRITGKKIYLLREQIADVSSSQIKEILRKKESLQTFVSDGVMRYIRENTLYGY